jgi:O-antigen/teichoic acid export membrane protein
MKGSKCENREYRMQEYSAHAPFNRRQHVSETRSTSSIREVRALFLKNTVMTIVVRVITGGFSLATVPFLISTVGMGGFGVWESLIAGSLLLQTLLQTPLTGTLWWRIGAAAAHANIAEVKRLFRLGVNVSLCSALLTSAAIWLARTPIVNLFHVPSAFASTAVIILPLTVAMILLTGVNTMLAAVLSGFQRTGFSTTVISGCTIIQQVLSIAFLFLGFGLYALLLGYSVGYLISTCALLSAARRLCGSLSLLPALPAGSDLKHFFGYGKMLSLGSLSAILRDSATKLVLTALASPVWVGYYSIAAKLCALLMEWLAFFSRPLYSASAVLHSAGCFEEISRLYSAATLFVACGIGYLFLIMAGMHELVLTIWLGRSIPEVDTILWLLLFGSSTAIILTGVGATLCRAIGRADIETHYLTFSLLINVAFLIILVPLIGAMGAVIASSASWSLAAIVFVFLLHKNLPLKREATLRAVSAFLLALCALGLTRVLVIHTSAPQTRGSAILTFGCGAALSGAFYLGGLFIFKIIPAGVLSSGLTSLRRCISERAITPA